MQTRKQQSEAEAHSQRVYLNLNQDLDTNLNLKCSYLNSTTSPNQDPLDLHEDRYFSLKFTDLLRILLARHSESKLQPKS